MVIYLFYIDKLNADLAGLLILGLSLLLLFGNNNYLIHLLAEILSIQFVPMAIIACSISIIFCLCIYLAVIINDMRRRQIHLIRMLAQIKLND
jgi:hypothetical protein